MAAAFLFDVDGTLIDSVDLHAQGVAGIPGALRLRNSLRRSAGADWQRRRSASPGLRAGRSSSTGIGARIEKYRGELFKRSYLPQVKPFPRVRDLFLRIRRDGHRIALASSANSSEVDHYKKLLNVDGLVDVQTSSSDVDCSKPCPDVFEVALQRLGADPAESARHR